MLIKNFFYFFYSQESNYYHIFPKISALVILSRFSCLATASIEFDVKETGEYVWANNSGRVQYLL